MVEEISYFRIHNHLLNQEGTKLPTFCNTKIRVGDHRPLQNFSGSNRVKSRNGEDEGMLSGAAGSFPELTFLAIKVKKLKGK